MKNIRKILKILQIIQGNLTLLDSVVDINRLVGISNAQGPTAKVIQDALHSNLDEVALSDFDQMSSDISKVLGLGPSKALSPLTSKQRTKKKRSSKKRTNTGPS
jgi:hypothetical protein